MSNENNGTFAAVLGVLTKIRAVRTMNSWMWNFTLFFDWIWHTDSHMITFKVLAIMLSIDFEICAMPSVPKCINACKIKLSFPCRQATPVSIQIPTFIYPSTIAGIICFRSFDIPFNLMTPLKSMDQYIEAYVKAVLI